MCTCKYVFMLLGCLASLSGAYGQTDYLLSVEHRAPRRTETKYFYLKEIGHGADLAQPNVLALEDAVYRVYYFRFREPSASSYFGCDKYGDQAVGEVLSLNDLLVASELNAYEQTQQAIETQCTALFENRGRASALLTDDLSAQDRIKMLKIELDFCTCKVSREKFSSTSDTLAMPRKVIQTGVFSDAERIYWLGQMHLVLENRFVESCLPRVDRYAQLYPVGQE